jgi:hypothetical protein
MTAREGGNPPEAASEAAMVYMAEAAGVRIP